MHAGKAGFKAADVLERAPALGVADWDKSKRSAISSVLGRVRTERLFSCSFHCASVGCSCVCTLLNP